MNFLSKVNSKPSRVFGTALVFLMLLALACGSAAAPETTAPATSAPPASAPTTVAAAPTTAPAVATPTAAPVPAASEVKVNPGKVTWMVGGWGNERFDRALSGGGDSTQYLGIVHGFLIETSVDLQLIPGIATNWELSSDGLTWTYTIRDGVKFHDGTDLTAEDVLWTFQHYFGPDSGVYDFDASLQVVARIRDSIELSGDNKVSLTTEIPFTSIPSRYGTRGPNMSGIMGARDQQHDEAVELAFDQEPIGAGGMRLVRHVSAEVMEFERFDDYYFQPKNGLPEDRRAKFTTFDQRLVPEEGTRVAAIRSGEADIAPVSLGARKSVEAGGGRLIFGREGVYFNVYPVMCWQSPDLFCHDKRVRQALGYAIDKELIRDQLYGPEVMEIKGWGYVSPSTIGYSPEVDPFPFDPDKARQLLAEAGYRTPANPQGKVPETFIVNAINATSLPLVPEAAQLVASMWEEHLGIDVEVRVEERIALKKAEASGNLAGQVYFRDNETRLDALGNMKSNFGDPERVHRRQNDPEVMAWINEIVSITDPVKQAAEANKLYLHLRDEQWEIGIGYVNIPWAVGSRVLSWEPKPLSLFPSALHTITLK